MSTMLSDYICIRAYFPHGGQLARAPAGPTLSVNTDEKASHSFRAWVMVPIRSAA